MRTNSNELAVVILFICKFAGGDETERGKVTFPEERTIPVPEELSIKETLKVWELTETFEFFKR